jgi:hypothetical protein
MYFVVYRWLLGFLSLVMPSCLESGSPRRGPLGLEDELLRLQNIGNYKSTKDVIPEGLNLHRR